MPKTAAKRDPYRLVGTMLGKYEILELVGTGGMGAVYRARHVNVQKLVALKILKPDLALESATVVRLFFEEAIKAGRLTHPNIIQVTDAEMTDDEIAFLVMEWLDGRTLDADLEANGVYSVERVAALLEQICDAVDYAHSQNIIHRDLKPSNIMVCVDRRGRETVKILDFGIAKALDSTLSLNSGVLGAPYYASPEQLTLSARIDQRSDIYTLGVTIYQLLTGRLPFNEESIEKVIQQHLLVSPPDLRAVRPELSEAVEAVVLRALAKRPAERYQNSVELARAFRQAAVGEPGALELRCTDELGKPLAGTVVYLDGKYAGQTDGLGLWRADQLSPREYAVEVSRPGYVSLQKFVLVEAGGEITFKLYLVEKDSGDLTIRVGIAGAHVLLNGAMAGKTDGSGSLHLRDLKTGEVEVEVRHRKYESSARRVRVVRGQTAIIDMTLSATPRFAGLTGAVSDAGRAVERVAGAWQRPTLKSFALPAACLLVAAVCVAAALLWRGVLVDGWHGENRNRPPTVAGSSTPAQVSQIELARRKDVAIGHARSGDEQYELETPLSYASAEEAYRRAVTLDPDNAEYRFKLGAALLRQTKYDASVSEFREAVRLAPSDAKYRLNLGYALSMKNDPSQDEEVLHQYREAIRLAEEQGDMHAQADYYRYLARTLNIQGKINESNEAYKKAARLKRDAKAADRRTKTHDDNPQLIDEPPLKNDTPPSPPSKPTPPTRPKAIPKKGNNSYPVNENAGRSPITDQILKTKSVVNKIAPIISGKKGKKGYSGP